MKYKSFNPTNKKLIAEYESTKKDTIIKIISTSRHAFLKWSEYSLIDRLSILKNVLKKLQINRVEIINQLVIEIGKPINQATKEVDKSLSYFEYYLENAGRYLNDEVTFEDNSQIDIVKYQPKGVTAVILPWNYPFMLFIWMIIPNLIAGNVVVLKHSENSLGISIQLDQILTSVLPDGVFQTIYGGAKEGKYLVNEDIDLICFTGSTRTGQELYEIAARKMINVVLEMGGSNPAIVFADYDINKAVDNIIEKRFTNNGQYCNAIKRVIVSSKISDKFIKILVEKVSQLKVGDPAIFKTQIGPLINSNHLNKIDLQVQNSIQNGAKLLCGGIKTGKVGYFYSPTVLSEVKNDMKVWNEETFGPVLPIMIFDTPEEAIRIANDTIYGLGATVFTKNMKLAENVANKLKCGMVDVNDGKSSKQCNPFGGVKCSGIGREHGIWGFRELTSVKSISLTK